MARIPEEVYESRKKEQYGVEGNILKPPVMPKKNVDSKNIHAGHRERVRSRFLKEGLDNFDDHTVLELLLFNTISRKDTNEEAHRLINTFGSLSNVFDASFEDLCKVKGIGEQSATLIKLVPQIFRKYETDKLNKNDVVLNSAEMVAKYTSKHFKGLTEERLYLLCLDANCKMLSFDLISSGTVNSTPLNNRLITEKTFSSKAASIILVHNHPSGITAPSKSDVNATLDIMAAMKSIGVRLSDHIIIGHGDDYFSFRKSEKWKHIF